MDPNKNDNSNINNIQENKNALGNQQMQKLNELESSYKYFNEKKENYSKLFLLENMEKMHLMEVEQDLIDAKTKLFQLEKKSIDDKYLKQDYILDPAKEIKDLFYKQLGNINDENNEEFDDCYFNLKKENQQIINRNNNCIYKKEMPCKLFPENEFI